MYRLLRGWQALEREAIETTAEDHGADRTTS